ncbi:unnamed protein product [Schistosoma curassoni]|uniref:AraC family transcriptional regulator n=1 Tax=Schistosoma curassoni TaxID=6186 RepID=A0A183K1K5_9TREM|nr:unnamed protein product [Schistosoma curassoni]
MIPPYSPIRLKLRKFDFRAPDFMVVGGSQQETVDPGFVLLGTRQHGVPAILRELVFPGGLDLVLETLPLSYPSRN